MATPIGGISLRLSSSDARRTKASGGSGPAGGLQRRRLTAQEIASGRVRLRVRKGRVEIGASPDGAARLRWQIRRGAPRLRVRKDALHITARRVRLILELPAEVAVEVRVRTGDITSWGAGNVLTLTATPGRVIGRELASPAVQACADSVSLHFAAAPRSVDLQADSVVLTVPPGPYAVDAPAHAQVTAQRVDPGSPEEAVGLLLVRGADVQVLDAAPPLPLTERDRT